MKHLFYFIATFGLLLNQRLLAQYPVSFPDGIMIGNSAVSIPSGSTYKLAVSGGIITEK
jgi:hypothetical protein